MNKTMVFLATGGLILASSAGTVLADSHGESGLEPPTPLELFSCRYNEGMGPEDLNKAADGWNAWADKNGMKDYSGWTLVPYYFSSEQEFDVLWLGGTESAAALGRAQDMWLATGAKEMEAFDKAMTCDLHANFATLQIKKPPQRENPGQLVVSFSDCNLADGVVFDDLVPSLMAWAEYREGHGSTSGMWILFPAYGGGGEEYDFKFVASWQNLEEQGVDYDQYNQSGWKKGNELFRNKVSCDSSRVYLATNRRMAESDGD